MAFSMSSKNVSINGSKKESTRKSAPTVADYLHKDEPIGFCESMEDFVNGGSQATAPSPAPEAKAPSSPKTSSEINKAISDAVSAAKKLVEALGKIGKAVLSDVNDIKVNPRESESIDRLPDPGGEWEKIRTSEIDFTKVAGVGKLIDRAISECYPFLGELVRAIEGGKGFTAIRGISSEKSEVLNEHLIAWLKANESQGK